MQTKRQVAAKCLFTVLFMLSVQGMLSVSYAQNSGGQNPSGPDPDKIAEDETARMETDLKLEDWQVFYVDSILRHNYTEMIAEMAGLQRSMVTNQDMYYAVRDKWNERSQNAFKNVLNEQQWKTYMRNGGEREARERQKRRDKALKAQQILDDKK